jgi:hypothetical protein
MAEPIEVRVTGRGAIIKGTAKQDASIKASCSLCAADADAVASLASGSFACAPCLRARLDALSVGRYRLAEETSGIPWGKVSG